MSGVQAGHGADHKSPFEHQYGVAQGDPAVPMPNDDLAEAGAAGIITCASLSSALQCAQRQKRHHDAEELREIHFALQLDEVTLIKVLEHYDVGELRQHERIPHGCVK